MHLPWDHGPKDQGTRVEHSDINCQLGLLPSGSEPLITRSSRRGDVNVRIRSDHRLLDCRPRSWLHVGFIIAPCPVIWAIYGRPDKCDLQISFIVHPLLSQSRLQQVSRKTQSFSPITPPCSLEASDYMAEMINDKSIPREAEKVDSTQEAGVAPIESDFVNLSKWRATRVFWKPTLVCIMAMFAVLMDGYAQQLPGTSIIWPIPHYRLFVRRLLLKTPLRQHHLERRIHPAIRDCNRSQNRQEVAQPALCLSVGRSRRYYHLCRTTSRFDPS